MLKQYILPDTFPQHWLQIPRRELVHIGRTVEWWEQQAVMRHCDNSFISVRATATAPHGSHPTRPTWGLSALLGPHSEIEHGDVQSYEVRMVQSIVTMKSLVLQQENWIHLLKDLWSSINTTKQCHTQLKSGKAETGKLGKWKLEIEKVLLMFEKGVTFSSLSVLLLPDPWDLRPRRP